MRAGHHPYWMRPSLHQQSVFVVRLRAFTLLSETIIWLRNDSYPLGNKYILYSSHVAMTRTQVLRLQRRQTRSAQLSRMYNKSARK